MKRLDRTLKVSDSVLTTPKIVDQITKSFEKTGKGFEKKRKSLEKTAAAGKVSETSGKDTMFFIIIYVNNHLNLNDKSCKRLDILHRGTGFTPNIQFFPILKRGILPIFK